MSKLFRILATTLFLAIPIAGISAEPQLVERDGQTQLLVDNRPFLIRGGELGNSSASSLDYMEQVWPKVRAMHINTLLVPVYWDLMEPEEGQFDFSLVEALIERARQEEIKLVLLWFGSWKNSMSAYVPSWVKRDSQRFPRAISATGIAQEILTPFSPANLEADRKAFAALMRYLKKTDRRDHTVLMVQVENEMGMLPSARDHHPLANAAFNRPVPDTLLGYLQENRARLEPELVSLWQKNGQRTDGSWQEVFGSGPAGEEVFIAWHLARYADAVAAAGKREYTLPMFVNAALNRPDVAPGDYPSGGPLPHLMDVWKAAAPNIDLLVPDFYNPRFQYWNDRYTRQGEPLLIPEIRFEAGVGAKALYAFGHYNTLGFSPFSIETGSDEAVQNLARSYALLEQTAPLIADTQLARTGVWLTRDNPEMQLTLGDYQFTARHELTLGWSPGAGKETWPEAGAIIVQTGAEEFLVAGTCGLPTATGKCSCSSFITTSNRCQDNNMKKITTGLLVSGLALCSGATAESAGNAVFDWFEYRGQDTVFEQPVSSYQYRNPILAGYYPDPSIVQVGGDYYLVNSSFAHFPGIPIFHSRDLVNWKQLGHVIDRPGQLDFSGLGISRGVFAPAISHYQDMFYLVSTCVDCGGNFVVTAKDPAGPWSDPVWLPDVGGIDPSLFFDDDGKAYIVNNDAPEGEPLYEGHRAIWVQAFDPETLATFGPRKQIVNGGVNIAEKPVWIEGPHLLRRNGQLYLTAAEGGTSVNHSLVVFKGTTPFGPFTPWKDNPILTQRHLDPGRQDPITSVGHADFVQDSKGDWWAVFLGVRPYAGNHYNTGRETFLMPVAWEDGWPVITRGKQTIPSIAPRPALPKQAAPNIPTTGNFTQRDEFDQAQLPLHWLQLRNPAEKPWYDLQQLPGSLQLTPIAHTLGDAANPAFLARRQQHQNALASTRLRFTPGQDTHAGMAVFQNREHFYFFGISRDNEGRASIAVKRRDGGEEHGGKTIASQPLHLPANAAVDVELRIRARGPAYDFHYRLSDEQAGATDAWQPVLLAADGRVVSTQRAGGFVGAVIGLHAYRENRN